MKGLDSFSEKPWRGSQKGKTMLPPVENRALPSEHQSENGQSCSKMFWRQREGEGRYMDKTMIRLKGTMKDKRKETNTYEGLKDPLS